MTFTYLFSTLFSFLKICYSKTVSISIRVVYVETSHNYCPKNGIALVLIKTVTMHSHILLIYICSEPSRIIYIERATDTSSMTCLKPFQIQTHVFVEFISIVNLLRWRTGFGFTAQIVFLSSSMHLDIIYDVLLEYSLVFVFRDLYVDTGITHFRVQKCIFKTNLIFTR